MRSSSAFVFVRERSGSPTAPRGIRKINKPPCKCTVHTHLQKQARCSEAGGLVHGGLELGERRLLRPLDELAGAADAGSVVHEDDHAVVGRAVEGVEQGRGLALVARVRQVDRAPDDGHCGHAGREAERDLHVLHDDEILFFVCCAMGLLTPQAGGRECGRWGSQNTARVVVDEPSRLQRG
jgi:hypothetical protein